METEQYYQSENPQCDYPEDFHHDNGFYGHTCVFCIKKFFGNKHRVMCKACKIQKEGEYADVLKEHAVNFGKFLFEYHAKHHHFNNTYEDIYNKYLKSIQK